MTYGIEHCVSLIVEVLAPKGSCSIHRWLTLDFEAESVEGKTFTWLAQYCAPSGYVHWRTLLKDGVPHAELTDRASWYKPRAPWVPLDSLTEGDHQETHYGEPVVAPSFVIASGAHDSCWRDNATRLSGWPMVQDGTWKNSHGETVPRMKATQYFYIYNDTKVRVKGISIKGPTSPNVWGSAETQAKFAAYTEGEWVNDTDLDGVWALLYGLSKLSKTVGHTDLDLLIDVTFWKGKFGTRSHRELRRMQHYRFRDGMVVRRGVSKENQFFLDRWEDEVEPYKLDQKRLMLDLGIAEKDHGKWTMNHLFPHSSMR